MKYIRNIVTTVIILIISLLSFNSFAQIPKIFQKFSEKQEKIQSGYYKYQYIHITDNDTNHYTGISYFIFTPNDLKYFETHLYPNDDYPDYHCKSEKIKLRSFERRNKIYYRMYELSSGPKTDESGYFTYIVCYFLLNYVKNGGSLTQIPPKIDKNNIRFKFTFPDDEMSTNNSYELEFNKKTLNWVHTEEHAILFETDKYYTSTEIIDGQFYDYIHPDILDTISFRYDELRKNYDLQTEEQRNINDSIAREKLMDSIVKLNISKGNPLTTQIPEEQKKDTIKYMPSWKAPLLSGGTLYSDSIQSGYVVIDMWYAACPPCRMAMKELATIDTLFDKSLVRFVSMNVFDKDTAKIRLIANSINCHADIVCTYDRTDTLLTHAMGDCIGYPQLYLVDMKTKQVIWRSCGYFQGFTEEIKAILRKEE